jgi:hypothetical protein
MVKTTMVATCLVAALGTATGAQSGSVPVPRPFPGSSPSAPSTGSTAPAPQAPAPANVPQAPAPPAVDPTLNSPATPLPTTIPVYPSAEFLESYDAGSGQRYYLYGSNLPYAEIVSFYRSALKSGGRELYKLPAMQQFDLGKFQEDTMAYPPSVVIKDYSSANSAGYLFVSGTTEKRYRTIIQIVPPGPQK